MGEPVVTGPREVNLRKILQFLATDGAFFYEAHNCHIIESEYIPTFGGTGSVTLRNDVAEFRLSLERDRLFMDVRAVGSKSDGSWFSIDIVRTLLTGEIADNAAMNSENTRFLAENFDALCERFMAANLAVTEAACRHLETRRSRRIFG